MVSRAKAMAVLVTLSVVVILSMGAVETRLLQNHFFNAAVEQVKASAQQLAGAVVELDVPAEDSETCREVAAWIYYNTGLRVLITDSASTVVVDSSAGESLAGEVIESELLKSTIATGKTNSFELPAAGQDQVAVSVPWQTADGISGSLIIVGPLKTFARDATDQIKPFILQAAMGAILVAAAGAFALSSGLSKGAASQAAPERAGHDDAETGSLYDQAQGNAGEPEDHGDEVADQTGDIGTTVTQTEEEQTG